MKCPVCKESTLVMSERHGIEIDYCPQCRGVWLDRGELDKIIEQASAQDVPTVEPPQRQPPVHTQRPPVHAHPPAPYPPPNYSPEYAPYYRRKKKWWKEVFDFD